MKPPLPEVSPTKSDILPSLFLQQTHSDPRNFAVSVLLHLCVAAVIAIALHRAVTSRAIIAPAPFTAIHLSDAVLFPSTRPGTGGETSGGSRHEITLASKGVVPVVVAHPLMTPTTHVPDDPPALVIPQTIASSTIPVILNGVIGDPHGVRGPASDGPGNGRGIGSGSGDGIGAGDRSGASPLSPGGGISMPRVIYDPEPEYTDEARKVKQQGNVLLACVVGTDGRIHDARVQRALGLGLDQKAIEAVRRWKFEPSRYNGKPVAVRIVVEVNFRMY
jgi:TonB family protein